MEAIQGVPDWRATADEIWAVLNRTAKMQEETALRQEENDRSQKETARQMKENAREMRESAKRLDQQIGKLGNRFGEIVEYMVAPNLIEKFSEIGLSFAESSSNKVIRDTDGIFLCEIDVLLENGRKALLVETKSKPSTEDVNDHVERLKKMRAWADLKDDQRKFLAAIAGVVMTEDVRNYALKQGFFVIEPSGETFTIHQPAGSPREW